MVLNSSCVFNPKKLDPFFIDFELNICVQYKIIETKPEIKFEQVGEEMPIGPECFKNIKGSPTVIMALPVDQALELKRAYEADQNKDKKIRKAK